MSGWAITSYINMQHLSQQIEAETKWPPFSRWHFQMDFFEGKTLNYDLYSLNFISNGPIANKSGDKPLSEPMIVWSTDAYMHHSASMS